MTAFSRAKEWKSCYRQTELANRAIAEEAISYFYTCVDYDTPRFIWFDSPFSCIVGGALLLSFSTHAFNYLSSPVEISHSDVTMVGDTIKSLQGLEKPLCFQHLVKKVYHNIFCKFPTRNLCEDILRTMFVKAKEIAEVARDNEEEHDWLAFYTSTHASFPKFLQERLDAWKRLCFSLTWWFPLSEVCFLSEQPIVYDQQQLVCRDFYKKDF